MPDFLNKLTNQFKAVLGKLTNVQKLIILGVVVVVIGSFFYLFSVSTEEGKVLLYRDGLNKADYERVRNKLDGMAVPYTTSKEKYLFVDSEQLATKLRAQLGLENVVRNLKGYELFDNPNFSTTDFERKIKVQQLVTNRMIRHLEALDDIERANVTISFSTDKQSFYLKELEDNPLTASVVITPAPGSDLEDNKAKVRGIRDLISKSVDRLKPENVTILTHRGTRLSDMLEPAEGDLRIKLAREQLRIKENIRKKYASEVNSLLSRTRKHGNYEVSINLSLDWSSKEISKEDIKGIVIKEDDPDTPQDESKILPSVPSSVQRIKENFKGPSIVPEGPAGTQPNIGPGLKELVDRYTDYRRQQETINNEMSKWHTQQKDAPYSVDKVSIVVALDQDYDFERDDEGEIKLVKGQVVPKYKKFDNKDIKNFEEMLKVSIPYERKKIKVSVKPIRFNRKDEFASLSEKLRTERKNKQLLLIGALSLLVIILLVFIIRLYLKERDRRRRLREEQFAREQQAMREKALLEAEKEGLGLDIPPEDRARLEMQENAINLARERPEDVAQLIRTWLVEE